VLAELHPRLPTLLERSATWAGRRSRYIAIAAACLSAAIAAAVLLAHLEADAPLFDYDLHPSQTAEVASALTLWGEQHHENAQATQIWVSAARRREVLLRLTVAGLPHRYVPTSTDVASDQTDMLAPLAVIDDRRRSGIEGDLVASLRKVSGVADATVVLPPDPDDTLSGGVERAAPTAAVQLVMLPGAGLSADAVSGIRRFVASAYPGLTPERVTVVDASGDPLGATAPPDRAASRESRVQSAVQSALDAVLGAGAAVVRVNVRTAGFEQQIQNTRTVPHGVLSADVGRERGTESNKTFDKERTVKRFAFDTLYERRTVPADAETRMSVAVFLDSKRVDPQTSGSISALVRAAAGADLQAGDDVVVQQVPFASPAALAPRATEERRQTSAAVVPAAIAIAALLFGAASFSRIRIGVSNPDHTVPLPVAARPIADPAVERAIATLDGESAQASAYYLRSLPDRTRNLILERMDPDLRDAIERFIEVQRGARHPV
jgi:flagellar biosynthesis/type III secretory pathway M-ring protein FliF/YscJ